MTRLSWEKVKHKANYHMTCSGRVALGLRASVALAPQPRWYRSHRYRGFRSVPHKSSASLLFVILFFVTVSFMGPQFPGTELLFGQRLNVNTTTAEALELLPGIGPSLAARIVADRSQHGSFSDLNALDRVPGIGPKTIEKLAPYLTVH
ncbi:MAG: helix-hairpin-helix domain-containing protein [Deltaproteobacteria bacterium]|nr:helix-hairpin-helix domain-containing protein [Deltaproteobacteria bacterium]